MDLRSSSPFWLMKNGYIKTYPALSADRKTDVAVMGAGISGAMAAFFLAKKGLDVTVLDKRHPGMGSTSARTALLQYEIDEPLHILRQIVGEKRADMAYRACYDAIDDIAELIRKAKLSCDFKKRHSLQYASYKKDVEKLEKEIEALDKLGFAVKWLDRSAIEKRYGFTAPAGILSARGAEVDAYRLAHGLLALPMENLTVYDTTRVKDIEPFRQGVRIRTDGGQTVTAGNLVIACGYESQKWLPFSVIHLLTTYAVVSKPIDPALFWEKRISSGKPKHPICIFAIPPKTASWWAAGMMIFQIRQSARAPFPAK